MRMRGELNGLKALIMNENAQAYYIHCFAHQLQLTLVAVAQNHSDVGFHFNMISDVLNIVGGSCKRTDILRDKQRATVVESILSGELKTGRGSNGKQSFEMTSCNEDFSQIDISPEEKDKLVAEVIRYVLFKTQQSSGCPIKREELTHLITKTYRQHRSLPNLIISAAIQKLSSIFGYEMKELQRSRISSTKQARGSQQSAIESKSYIIVSQLHSNIYTKYVDNKRTSHMTGFTFVVISIVRLAGGKISEENLWHQLKRLGLHETDDNHPLFGNTKQTLETLVQQRYLQKEKVNGPEGNIVMYELAERALDVSEKLKDYIAQIASRDMDTVEVDAEVERH